MTEVPENGLRLIVGPPNSGRSGAILDLLSERADDDPLLIVPASDDVERFERDLSARGASIGVAIRSFPRLFDELSALAPQPPPPSLSKPQRMALIRAACTAAPLRRLRRSAASAGFATALARLITELQSARVSPATLTQHTREAEGADTELELASLFEAYLELLAKSGHSDPGTIAESAIQAVAAEPEDWIGRPVALYGFDDLDEQQLELVRALSEICPVTVAVHYADRRALAARATLLGRLREFGAEIVTELDFDPSYTAHETLRHLDQSLFEPGAGRVPVDGGVRFLEAAGDRGEAELIGAEIAELLTHGGMKPDEIIVTLRHPASSGPLFASILRELGVPVALHASIDLGNTAVGRSLVALCEAAGAPAERSTGEALLAHLRSDPSVPGALVDRLELRLRRGECDDAVQLVEEWSSPPRHLSQLREAHDGPARIRALARSALELAEAVHREKAPVVRGDSDGVPLDPIELRAARDAAEMLGELAATATLPGCDAPDLPDAIEAIQSERVAAWRGSSEGRVRIAGPDRVRAARARCLFCAGMQEGSFPAREPLDPLLGEEARARLAIPALRRREASEDERYRFHVCVSRPTERLYVSWQQSSDDGTPLPRSPFVDELLDLIGSEPEQTEKQITISRGLADVVPAIDDCSTERLLARALAHRGSLAPPSELELPSEVRARVEQLLAHPDPLAAKPGPLHDAAVLAQFGERDVLSANSLEGWINCSYRWFVDHELGPQRLEPTPDPLWLGSVVHEALEQLYRDPPGDDGIPRPGDLKRWQRRFGELLDAAIAQNSKGGEPSVARQVALARLRIQIEAFLASESESETALRPRRDLLEVGFGMDPEDPEAPGPLELGEGLKLRGRIDRIDVAPDGHSALLRDYKTSREVHGVRGIANEGKLQIQLYMLAAQTLLDLDPIGGVYHPLAATSKPQPRGMYLKGNELIEKDRYSRADALPAEQLEEQLEAARELAVARGTAMRGGQIARDPRGGKCPRWCTYQPICRLERAVGLEEDGNGGPAK